MNKDAISRLLRRKSTGLALAALTPMLAFSAPIGIAAQDQGVTDLTLRGYPLAIHQGTCETVIAEPAYDLGFLVPRPLYATDDTADGVFGTTAADADRDFGWNWFYADDRVAPQNELIAQDTGFLFDDVTGDGFYDYGFDLDGDAVLTDDELIERPIMWGYESDFNDIDTTGPGLADTDTDAYDLRAVPHVVMIHRGDWNDQDYMACGEIDGVADADGDVVFGMRPVTANTFVGTARVEQGTDGFLGIGGDAGRVEVYVMPSQFGQPLAEDAS